MTLAVFYRVVGATDGSSYSFGLNQSVKVAGAILRYTGADPSAPINVSGFTTGDNNSPTAPAVTTTVADTMVVRIAGIDNNSLASVPGTELVLVNVGGSGADVALGVGQGTQTAADTTGTAAFASNNDAWVTATIALRSPTIAVCAVPGRDGSPTSLSGVVNTYYPGTATANAGAASISVGASQGATTPIASGDLLLVIQMQDAAIDYTNTSSYGNGSSGSGATNYNSAGLYEFVRATGPVSGGSVPIQGTGTGLGLRNTYTNDNATAIQGQRRFQVVRVPQYDSATVTGQITAQAWNGSTGGIVVMDVAGTLTFSGGGINVDAKGFRGGGGQQLSGQTGGSNTAYRTRATPPSGTPLYNGNKAEGVAGSPNYMYDGTATLASGSGYPDGTNADASRARGAPGNAGGGGTDGNPSANDQNSGGGGGAGGSVLVFARTGVLTSLTINAKGANGTNADPTGSAHGPGGGGAGGVIYLSSAAVSTSVTGGANGTTTAAANAYGATSGTAGVTNTNLTESQIPGVTSGATCKATLASVAEFGATVEGGRVVLYWETAFELGTAGFHIERLEPISGDYDRLNDTLLPALITSPQGGRYTFVDLDAWPDQSYTYRLVEQEVWGSTRVHGPFTVTPVESAQQVAKVAFVAESSTDSGAGYDDPAQGYQAIPHALDNRNVERSAQVAISTVSKKKKVTDTAQIPVRQDGLFYASVARLAEALGNTEENVRKWLRNEKLELTTAGKDVAWLPAADEAGILFYGEAIDSLYTLDNIYRLRSNQKGKVMEESSAKDKAPDPVAAGDFDDTITAEQDIFAATVVSTDPESDYWYWEGFIGGGDPICSSKNWNTKCFTVRLPDVADGGKLKVFLKGAVSGTHSVQVSINGQTLGEGTWSDLADYELRLSVTGAQLQSGDNDIKIRALGDSANIFYVDRIEMKYRRLARATDDRLTLKAESDGPLAVDGFSTADIYVFDIGNLRKPVYITHTTVTPGTVGQSVTFTAEQGRRYLVLTGAAITSATPAPMTAADLQSSSDPVDYLIIVPPALVDAAQTLADYRQGKGLSSRVVGTDEIYDSYNWGVASPHAVRDFLRDAFHNWGVRYVVLVGIGSFDYRDLGGKGEPQAPTLMTSTPNGLFGCDNCLVDFDGDGAPDMAIGRIPAASVVDLQTYLAKVEAYEKGTVSLYQAGAMLLADKPDSAAGYFPQDSDWVAELLPSGIAVTRIYLDQQAIGAARSLLFEGMNRGTGWVNYLGHGGADRFSAAGLLTWDDMGTLNSVGPLPVVSALTCAANRFEVPRYASLGEQLILDADGGAIAVWAPTGMSLNEPALRLNRSLFAAVFQQQMPTLGEAIQQALQDNIRRQDMPTYMLRIYSLLGDSALQLHH
ncbi:hypothetical protein E4P82_09865 [Candidatus Competibacter phosphatis]|uniref:Gingipain domain-containing protein n=1 Tax=Candidatus Competibacter phosphatis TaxID=221280 RepID=A0ABX1TJD0_9GAMM|nr:C25 family cysteine peptidase [Candidatus Competibacter phosphatis]NMQ19477.1 hypothetical protein [Candidatus Competibacter phosphatis]